LRLPQHALSVQHSSKAGREQPAFMLTKRGAMLYLPRLPKRVRALLLVAAPTLLVMFFHHGYCWGWWGHNSLLQQYLFEAACPAASQAQRYAPFVVVAPPSTQPVFLAASPTGRSMLYAEQRPTYQVFHYDFATGQRVPVDIQKRVVIYINESIVLVPSGPFGPRTVDLLNLDTGARITISYKHTARLADIDLDALRYLQAVGNVYVSVNTSPNRDTSPRKRRWSAQLTVGQTARCGLPHRPPCVRGAAGIRGGGNIGYSRPFGITDHGRSMEGCASALHLRQPNTHRPRSEYEGMCVSLAPAPAEHSQTTVGV
jgi:hypothetical protein